MLKVGMKVKDLMGDFECGVVIDKYLNQFSEGGPCTMFIVDFGDDQIFDRLPHEICELKEETQV